MFNLAKRFLRNWQYEIGIFAVLMVGFLNNLEPIGRWRVSSNLLFSYQDFGFVNRALTGSIIRFLSSLLAGGGEVVISKAFIWYFLVFSLILCFVFISFLFGHFIKASQEKNFLFSVGIVIVYLASPFSLASLFQAFYYLSPDYPRTTDLLVYHRIFTLAQIDSYGLIYLLLIVWILALKKESRFQILIPFLCFCVVANHSMGSFVFVPTIVILLSYNMYKNSFSKSSMLLFIVSFILMLCVSVYLRLIAPPPNFEYQTLEDIYKKLPKTDFPLDENDFDGWFRITYFKDIKARFFEESIVAISYVRLHLAFTILISSPFFVLWILFWKKAIRTEKNKFLKTVFIFSSIVLSICSFTLFFVMNDGGRIFFYFFSAQFILACFFFYKGEEAIVKTAEEAALWAKKHIFIVFILIVYLLTLGKTNYALTFPMFSHVKEIVLNLIS